MDAAQSLFHSLPRHIKNLPLIETLIGSSSSDLYEAIFDVEHNEFDLFQDSDEDELPALRSIQSRDNVRSAPSPSPRRNRRPLSNERPSRVDPEIDNVTVTTPTGLRHPSMLEPPHVSIDIPLASGANLSPLSKLFGPQRAASSERRAVASVDASVRRVESMLDDIRDLPVHRLKDEMKELQVGFGFSFSSMLGKHAPRRIIGSLLHVRVGPASTYRESLTCSNKGHERRNSPARYSTLNIYWAPNGSGHHVTLGHYLRNAGLCLFIYAFFLDTGHSGLYTSRVDFAK